MHLGERLLVRLIGLVHPEEGLFQDNMGKAPPRAAMLDEGDDLLPLDDELRESDAAWYARADDIQARYRSELAEYAGHILKTGSATVVTNKGEPIDYRLRRFWNGALVLMTGAEGEWWQVTRIPRESRREAIQQEIAREVARRGTGAYPRRWSAA